MIKNCCPLVKLKLWSIWCFSFFGAFFFFFYCTEYVYQMVLWITSIAFAHSIIFSASSPWKDTFCSFHRITEAETIGWNFFFLSWFTLCYFALSYFGELTDICMKAQAHEMENKIKTGNSSMFCNKENKRKNALSFFPMQLNQKRPLILTFI